MKKAVVLLENVSTGYASAGGQTRTVTSGVSTSLRTGELTCLLGPNGAGKSTLMRTIAGMQPPLDGAVLIGGRNVQTISARDLAR
jgi:iron complex transport system ATP-binding protein